MNDLDRAVQRLEKKIDCGAHYFITQPLYSTKQIEEVYEATKHLTTPVYIGIMPLTSARNTDLFTMKYLELNYQKIF